MTQTMTDVNIERLPVVNASPQFEMSGTMPKSDVEKLFQYVGWKRGGLCASSYTHACLLWLIQLSCMSDG
jgi:hypothetical protein